MRAHLHLNPHIQNPSNPHQPINPRYDPQISGPQAARTPLVSDGHDVSSVAEEDLRASNSIWAHLELRMPEHGPYSCRNRSLVACCGSAVQAFWVHRPRLGTFDKYTMPRESGPTTYTLAPPPHPNQKYSNRFRRVVVLSLVAATSLVVPPKTPSSCVASLPLPPPGPHLSPPPSPPSSADTVALGRDHSGAARGAGPAGLSPGWRRSDDTGGGSGAALGCGRSAMCARAHRRCSSVRPTRRRFAGPAMRRLIPLSAPLPSVVVLPFADRAGVLFPLACTTCVRVRAVGLCCVQFSSPNFVPLSPWRRSCVCSDPASVPDPFW